MRHHPRPFVVEVKRGTNRQSFQSHSSDAEKFSAAETLLFSKTQVEPVIAVAPQTKPGHSGRVLPVLSDLQDIAIAERFPAPRRGRPPGSKNKVKPVVTVLLSEAMMPAKSVLASEVAVVEPGTNDDRHEAQAQRVEEVSSESVGAEAAVTPASGSFRTARLRDRSRILRRYVLGIEPRAGERSSFRTKKRKLERQT